MAFTDDELYDMSDEALEAAFKEAKSQEDSPDTDIENEYDDTMDVVEDEIDEEIDLDDSEEVVEDLEQPDEDSDDDASLDDDDEEDSDEDSEDDDGDLDEEPETDDEDPEKEEDESEEDKQPVQRKHKYRANGQDYEFSEDEILERFGQVFGQSMNYTQKMQQIKPWRKTIDAIEEAKLSHDDVNFAIDVLKGDKDAIAELLRRTGTDTLDLDTENTQYTPKDYGRNDTELDIKEIVADISRDKEYTTTYNVLENQWDEASKREFFENPEMIRQLHIDVKNGMFDIVAPMANKLKVYDGNTKSDLAYYKLAAQQYFNSEAQEEARRDAQRTAEVERNEEQAKRMDEVKARDEKRKATKSASSKRKAAAPTKSKAGSKKVVDYLEDTDDAFDEWYQKLQDSQ